MAMTLEKFLSRKPRKNEGSIGNCGVCHNPITDVHPDVVRRINGKPVHEDCYYEELGEGIEKHPICSPSVRRG